MVLIPEKEKMLIFSFAFQLLFFSLQQKSSGIMFWLDLLTSHAFL